MKQRKCRRNLRRIRGQWRGHVQFSRVSSGESMPSDAYSQLLSMNTHQYGCLCGARLFTPPVRVAFTFMKYWTYILVSESTGRHYCGSTDDIQRRVRQHNDPNHTNTKTTKRFQGPWKLIWTQAHETRAEAMELEKRVKKRGIARFLSEQNE